MKKILALCFVLLFVGYAHFDKADTKGGPPAVPTAVTYGPANSNHPTWEQSTSILHVPGSVVMGVPEQRTDDAVYILNAHIAKDRYNRRYYQYAETLTVSDTNESVYKKWIWDGGKLVVAQTLNAAE